MTRRLRSPCYEPSAKTLLFCTARSSFLRQDNWHLPLLRKATIETKRHPTWTATTYRKQIQMKPAKEWAKEQKSMLPDAANPGPVPAQTPPAAQPEGEQPCQH
jgi:hypothetical protein